MAVRTDGIKLSNLYLRDGNNTLVPLNEAYIGDMVGKDTVSSEQLGSFLLKVNNFMTGGDEDGTVAIPDLKKISFSRDLNNPQIVYLQYDGNLVNGSDGFPISFTDTNTLYDYHIGIESRTVDNKTKNGIKFTNNYNTAFNEWVELPEEGQKLNFIVEGGLGKFSVQE